jgi:hypothetical protein
MDCCYNNIILLNLTGLNKLTSFSGWGQLFSLTLYESSSNSGHWGGDIAIDEDASFENTYLTYSEGTLWSSRNTVTSSYFSSPTGLAGKTLGVTLSLTYRDASSSGSGGGGSSSKDDDSSPVSGSINISRATFDNNRNGADYRDIAVTLTKGSYTLLSIYNGSYTLKKDTDYTVSGNTYTIKKEYLSTLKAGTAVITFNMKGGTDPTLTVTVVDTATEVKPSEQPFADVSQADWFAADVEWAHKQGIFNGISDTMFGPNEPMTRGMLVTALHRLAGGLNVSGDIAFSDVSADEYYASAVRWATQNGLVNGMSDSLFAPNDSITRQDLAVILERYMDYAQINPTVIDLYVEFADEEEIADYAKNAIQTLNKLRIINGVGNNTIDPRGSATRAQIAAIMHRFTENLK